MLGSVTAKRTSAILGDMMELGESELDLHAGIAGYDGMDTVDTVHCVGERMSALHDALPEEKRGEQVETAKELAAMIPSMIEDGDFVLVKGSNSLKLSQVVDAIEKLGHPPKE